MRRNSLSARIADLSAGEDVVKKGDMGMIKYDEIVGMPVFSSKEGKGLGWISKMAIDLKEGQVVGFLIDDKNGSEMFLPIGNVDTYGKDVIMAASESDLRNIDDLTEMAAAIEFGGKIIGLKIITKEGENFGEIASFCFDEKSGLITHYVTSRGLLNGLMHGKGLLPQEGVRALSLDALVVTKKAVEISDIMKTGPGIKQKTGAAVQKTEQVVKTTISKVEKIVKA